MAEIKSRKAYRVVPDPVATLFYQATKLAQANHDNLKRSVKIGRKLDEADRQRKRLVNAIDALLRKAHAEEFVRLGAEEFDIERLEVDTPFDGVLIAIARRHVPNCENLIQLVPDATVPAPLFAAELLDVKLERHVVSDATQTQAQDADILVVDRRLLGAAPLKSLVGRSVRLVTLFQPAGSGEGVVENSAQKPLAESLNEAGFESVYIAPSADYAIGWK